MIYWLSILGAVAILSLVWAIQDSAWRDTKIEIDRTLSITLAIYTFVVASGFLIYSIMKG